MKKSTKKTATPDEIWAILRENAKGVKEIRALQKETSLQMKETERKMQETDRMIKERSAETDRRIKLLQKEVSGIGESNGEFAEEYFRQVFETDADKTFAGMHFDAMETNIDVKDPKIQRQDEYDIVLYNDESIAIVETKYRGRERNIKDVIDKADSFRFWFPRYKKHKVYLALAGLSFEKDTLRKAKEHGIAIIRQKGDKTIVYDKNLKAY